MFAGLRQYDRKDASIEVLVVDEDGWIIPFETVNISQSGVFVRTDLLFELGLQHTLVFRQGGEEVRLAARIVRIEDGKDGDAGMAYAFERTDQSTFQGLSDLVASL